MSFRRVKRGDAAAPAAAAPRRGAADLGAAAAGAAAFGAALGLGRSATAAEIKAEVIRQIKLLVIRQEAATAAQSVTEVGAS